MPIWYFCMDHHLWSVFLSLLLTEPQLGHVDWLKMQYFCLIFCQKLLQQLNYANKGARIHNLVKYVLTTIMITNQKSNAYNFFSILSGKKHLHSVFLVPHVQDQQQISKDSRVETELLYFHQIPSMLVKLWWLKIFSNARNHAIW